MTGSIRSRELGRWLLQAQRAAEFTGNDLAAKLGSTASTVSRTMTGHRTPHETEVATLLGLCGVPSAEHDRLLRLSRLHEDSSLHLPLDDAWSAYLVHAANATRLVDVQPTLVPWPVQTAEYTRAVLGDAAKFDARRDALSLLRLPRMELLLHEWALRTTVGDEPTMSEQLHHLLRISVRPNLSLRVIPIDYGLHHARYGAFTLLEYATYPSVLYREDPAEGILSDDHTYVGPHRSMVESLTAATLNEQQSRELIGRIAVELYSGDGEVALLREVAE